MTPVAVVAIADPSSRQRACEMLRGFRWIAQPAQGGADSLVQMQLGRCDALLVDSWLPDLEIREFLSECGRRHPEVDIVMLDEAETEESRDRKFGERKARNPRRNELLHVLREVAGSEAGAAADGIAEKVSATFEKVEGLRATDGVAEKVSATIEQVGGSRGTSADGGEDARAKTVEGSTASELAVGAQTWSADYCAVTEAAAQSFSSLANSPANAVSINALPELIGEAPVMQELARRIRLLAPRKTTVLIEGPTGTGKELVARALHRLSPRSQQPMKVINCAAIPEALLEAELFGHTRGAFTGAVNARIGRIESAHGGTLFLDEIGEMPVALQSKLLRFLESGELQRVGDNGTVQVDVRVIAATNQPLAQMVRDGRFRGDLMYRLAVFPMRTPSLAERKGDVALLAEHFLRTLSQQGPARKFRPEAMQILMGHSWPGNVRELQHVIERAYILADDRAEITAADVELDLVADGA